jgi:F-type H+-transporting ATPase subunit delta
MSDRAIIARYAKALYLASQESSQLDTVNKDIEVAHQIFQENPELGKFLRSPAISRKSKMTLLRESFGGQVSEIVLNFWQLLLDKNRQDVILQVFPVFREIRQKDAQIYEAVVSYASASAIADEQMLTQFIKKNAALPAHATILTRTKINPELIGGFILQVDNKYFDYSLKGQLDRLKNEI